MLQQINLEVRDYAHLATQLTSLDERQILWQFQ
jgi:hypothetical protein